MAEAARAAQVRELSTMHLQTEHAHSDARITLTLFAWLGSAG